jgi:predicted dehydrogenase/nucleoside-diphosphate-sugar epimerase
MTKRIKVGVIGAGYVASRHLRALRDLPFVDIVGICDVDKTRASELAARFGVPRVCGSLSELLELEPQAVHVLTPPASHCELTLAALDRNCHVLVEKPMAETPSECDLMISRARERGLTLSVNHSLLFEPAMQRALKHIDGGDLGDVLSLTYFRGSDYPAYPGGTPASLYTQGSYPFRDLGVHAIYLIERILGPIRDLDVRHLSTGRHSMLSFDEWRASCDCEKGTASVVLSWNMRPQQNEVWVHGTRGHIHLDMFLQQCHLYRAYPGPKQLSFAVNGMRHAAAALVEIPAFMLRAASGRIKPSPGIYDSVTAFHRAISAGKPAPISPEGGRRAVYWVNRGSHAADVAKKELERQRESYRPRPARILVTGAGGFLGSALVQRLLDRGDQPRLFLRRPAPPSSPLEGLDAIIGSLGDPNAVDRAVEGVDVVYHVGAAMKGEPNDFEAGTTWGTRNIVEACLRHNVKKLIYVSSFSILDVAGKPEGVPVSETSSLEPNPALRGLYTRTKLEAERIVLDAIRNRALPAVILRPAQIFGPGSERTTPSGVIQIAGQWIVAGNGKRHLPLVYVGDVVSGLVAAETAPAAVGRIIHLSDPTPVTQNEYLKWCAPALAGAKVRRVPIGALMASAWMCDLLARLLKRSLPLSRYRIRSLRPLYPADISLAASLLGWTPEIGTSRGLFLTFDRFRHTESSPALQPGPLPRAGLH